MSKFNPKSCCTTFCPRSFKGSTIWPRWRRYLDAGNGIAMPGGNVVGEQTMGAEYEPIRKQQCQGKSQASLFAGGSTNGASPRRYGRGGQRPLVDLDSPAVERRAERIATYAEGALSRRRMPRISCCIRWGQWGRCRFAGRSVSRRPACNYTASKIGSTAVRLDIGQVRGVLA